MPIVYEVILTTIIFMFAVWLISWSISNHRFRTLTIFGLYFVAIAQGFFTALAEFAWDKVIMSLFDSTYIYILFSIYLIVLGVMLATEKGWLKKFWKSENSPNINAGKNRTPASEYQNDDIKSLDEIIDGDLKALEYINGEGSS